MKLINIHRLRIVGFSPFGTLPGFILPGIATHLIVKGGISLARLIVVGVRVRLIGFSSVLDVTQNLYRVNLAVFQAENTPTHHHWIFCNGCAASSQALKSPTKETACAFGAHTLQDMAPSSPRISAQPQVFIGLCIFSPVE